MPLFNEVQSAATLLPTDVMKTSAATTMRPATMAYSRTSPPCSSRTRREMSCLSTLHLLSPRFPEEQVPILLHAEYSPVFLQNNRRNRPVAPPCTRDVTPIMGYPLRTD